MSITILLPFNAGSLTPLVDNRVEVRIKVENYLPLIRSDEGVVEEAGPSEGARDRQKGRKGERKRDT